jgi:drug/metabolite transporter (DMT)-like permease
MLIGVLLKILSTVAFTAMGIGVRAAAPSCPIAEIVFFRSAIALVVLLAWLRISGDLPAHLATSRPLGHLGRGLSGTAGMFANFLALSLLPLADATSYFYVSPLFVTLIAALVLREKVLLTRWIAVAIGFFGVLVMLSDHMGFSAGDSLSTQGLGAIVALSGAGFAALSIIQTRRLAISEHTGAIVFYFTCLTTFFGGLLLVLAEIWPAGAVGAPFLAGQAYVAPGAREWAALAGVGVAGGAAQILATMSYRYADASLLASFDYLAMLWALLASLAFFGEWPSAAVIFGAAAIAGSGLLAILGERAARRRKASLA